MASDPNSGDSNKRVECIIFGGTLQLETGSWLSRPAGYLLPLHPRASRLQPIPRQLRRQALTTIMRHKSQVKSACNLEAHVLVRQPNRCIRSEGPKD